MLEALEDEVAEKQAELVKRSTTPCSVAAVLSELDEADATRLRKVLGSKAWASSIESTLARHGITLGRNPIERHRRRGRGNGCSCPV